MNTNLIERSIAIGKKKKGKTHRIEPVVHKPEAKSDTSTVENRVFAHEPLLHTKEVQRSLWGEPMEGEGGVSADYELKLLADGRTYLEKRMGETAPGKMYTLTDEQLDAVDEYMTDQYKRVEAFDKGGKYYLYTINEG